MAIGRKTGGRTAGTLNKATAELKVLAAQYTQTAVTELARLITGAESETARVAAIKEMLDRAHGRAPQAVTLDGNVDIGLHAWLIAAQGEKPKE